MFLYPHRSGCATASCTCHSGYWQANCSLTCPGGVDNPCNGHGSCDVSTGKCHCDCGFDGEACNVTRCDEVDSCSSAVCYSGSACTEVCGANIHGQCTGAWQVGYGAGCLCVAIGRVSVCVCVRVCVVCMCLFRKVTPPTSPHPNSSNLTGRLTVERRQRLHLCGGLVRVAMRPGLSGGQRHQWCRAGVRWPWQLFGEQRHVHV